MEIADKDSNIINTENTCTWFNSIQFNWKTLFKDGDPVSSQLIFPEAIQTCDQTIQPFF